MARQNAVFSDRIFRGKFGYEFVRQKTKKAVGRPGSKLVAFKRGHQIAATVGIHNASDEHRRQAAIRSQVTDSRRNIALIPLSIEQNQQRHALHRMRWHRDKNVPLLSQNLRFQCFVLPEGQREILCERGQDGNVQEEECEEHTTARDESHFILRLSSQEGT